MSLQEALTSEAGTGNLQLALKFAIYEGVERPVFFPLTDEAREKWVDRQLKELGFNGDFKEPKFDDSLYDPGISLWCAHETYQGKTREKWSISNGGGVR